MQSRAEAALARRRSLNTLPPMATDVVRADLAEAPTSGVRPYSRRWLNVLIDVIDGLPGSPWVTYLVLAAAMGILSTVQAWVGGLAPWGEVSLVQAGWGVFTVACLAAVHLVDGIARSAFDTVRPLTSIPEPEAARLRYELTVFPAVPSVVILALGIPLTVMGYIGDPVAAGVVGYSPLALALRAISESFVTAVLLVLILQAIRQLRCVRRIHDQVIRIDLFHPRPLYAFSRLTGVIGGALVAVVAFGLILAPSQAEVTSIWYVGWYLLFLGSAVGVFVIPLQGLHSRLAT